MLPSVIGALLERSFPFRLEWWMRQNLLDMALIFRRDRSDVWIACVGKRCT